MAFDFVYAAIGLAILLLAGDALVKGAVNVSLRIGVPALIVSLTVVACGTSAPEMLVSMQAVLRGAPGIALGNVVGSNIANILLVLGVPALISGLTMKECHSRKSYLHMMLATLLFIGLAFLGPIAWRHGLVLLAGLALVLADAFRDARAHRREAKNGNGAGCGTDDIEGADPSAPGWQIVLFLALGIAGLPLGADMMVDGSMGIATTLGVRETAIGLTLVALGTSLPELATTVMAVYRGRADVAIGNVLGSNMFNLLAIIGATSFVGRIPVERQFLDFDLWVMLAVSVLLAPFVLRRWDMTRPLGAVLTALYVVYVLFVFR